MIVAGTLWGSVVARIKRTWGGGSSMIFKRALNADWESICTSSMIYTRYWQTVGAKFASSRRERISPTPLLEAASISVTSKILPSSIPLQLAHARQGFPSTGCRQLTAFARIFEQVVLPVPREPVNR